MKRYDKVVLAYSGGLDTSVAIPWLKENYGADSVAVAIDVGQESEMDVVRERALGCGAIESYIIDAREEYLREYAFPALQANARYEGQYYLHSALSRPLIAKKLVEVALRTGAEAVVHGCTGKGNDQVRFDVSFKALAPKLGIIAPIREWKITREDEIRYAKERNLPIPMTAEKPYSIDENAWGRSIECGKLEDPWVEPTEDIFAWTKAITDTPSEPHYLEIAFERGIPVAIDGNSLDPMELVHRLNIIGGEHGIGRVDMVENRMVGIKSREIYEMPGATLLHMAHKALENFVQPKDLLDFKESVDFQVAQLIYRGLWFSPLREALFAFVAKTQEQVSGVIRLRLFKGNAAVVGRRSPYSMYRFDLATYDHGDTFNHQAAVGFIELYSLPNTIFHQVKRRMEETTGVDAGATADE